MAPITGTQLRTRTLRRLACFAVAMCCLVGAITARLINVQVTNSPRYVAYGASQRDGYRALPASRGAIYDRNGQAFVMSVAQPTVIADPSQVKDPAATAETLNQVLGLDRDELVDDLSGKGRYKVIAKAITEKQASKLGALIDDHKLVGVTLEDEYIRSAPNDDLAAPVLGNALPEGQVDTEGNSGGISGLERQYNAELAGHPGKLFYEQDAGGRPIAGGEREVEPAKQGADLYLTLDQSLQYETERSLAAQVKATGAKSAMAVIMRPSTGEILSMASVQVDDEGDVTNTLDNRPVTAVFEPGSVNKMITVAAAIEEGAVAPSTIFNVPDTLPLHDVELHDSHPHPPTDWSVTDILVTSSNIGTIRVAQQIGKAKMDTYLRDFGFGATTGLGFPAEEDGIMKDLADWSGVDIGTIPMGQGISVTALQMLAAYNVVANDGVYVQPRLVASMDSGSGPVPTEPSSGHRVVSADTAATMRAMLAKVVTDGTGKAAAVPGYEAAGKTGTARLAQGADSEDGYLDENGDRHYQASFVGLVNGADLSIIVSLEDPQTSIYGADVAAPVFSHLAATALRRFQVPPPALLDEARRSVPDLSATARSVDGGDVVGATLVPAG